MKRPFKKGDQVRTGFWERETKIVRKVISCTASETTQGGWLVEADGGEPCDCCGYKGQPTPPLSVDWFQKVEEKDG
jgi:hypothetical protein